MEDLNEQIERLTAKINSVAALQVDAQQQIAELRVELFRLKKMSSAQGAINAEPEKISESKPVEIPSKPVNEAAGKVYEKIFDHEAAAPKTETKRQERLEDSGGSELEKFIGENLISKIGIVILIIGVGIFAKFAIDNNWVTPLMRIVGGYSAGILLVGLAVRLKPKYLNFSAVLLSGGMTINYFITFFAYSFYGLIDQTTAFLLMVMFTVFTVAAALIYERQIIAHLGLVGAYFVPFLLSEDTGRYDVLFSYIAIINLGILAVSVKKYWKPLFYTSYAATWLIFGAWFLENYSPGSHFSLALGFSFIFFLIFHITFIVYKLISEEDIAIENVGLVLANAFIFYGFGYSMIDGNERFDHLLGSFTVANAGIHFFFALIIDRLKLPQKDLVYLSAILVLTFITIAAPVQIDGSVVTLFWSAEAAFLFWLGRSRAIRLFEYFSYPVMVCASLSLFHDWISLYDLSPSSAQAIYPLFNAQFAVGLFFIAAFALIVLINRSTEFENDEIGDDFRQLFSILIGTVLIFAVYNVFRMEIGTYFYYPLVAESENQSGVWRNDYEVFNIIWQLNYSMLFSAALGFINLNRLKSAVLGFANLLASGFIVFAYLTLGLYLLDVLRAEYFNESGEAGVHYFLIRYVCAACFAILSYVLFKYSRSQVISQFIPEKLLQTVFDIAFYLAILVLTSFEIMTWFEILEYADGLKYGLSITWGFYSVFLIVLGIIHRKLHLRIFAIALLAVTVAKLFLYDIADLPTIPKTIVFVALGILLLFVSFLYTKYKNVIFDEKSDPPAVADG